jgi:outer membrane receptor protein involved in Fe transport
VTQIRAEAEIVVVTGQPANPVGAAAFSVVTLDNAELPTYGQLDKSLSKVPGFSLFRRDFSLSANPTTQGASLRAIAPTGASRALVLLDGIPQNDPFGGWVIWSSLPAEAIAQAQIVRGAGAGPYGAGALTGTISLSEWRNPNRFSADVYAGELETRRAAAAVGVTWAEGGLFAAASSQSSNGWIPVKPPQRGAADANLTLEAANASARLDLRPDGATVIALRLGAYREERESGIKGAASEARGRHASVSAARRLGEDLAGRVQIWLRGTDFTNRSVAVAADRTVTTPASDQFATPALGWGANASLRDAFGRLTWEIGADYRAAEGESQENFAFVSGAFTRRRAAGGRTEISGLYGEGAYLLPALLLTVGIRGDAWRTSDGHLSERMLAGNAITLEEHPEAREGIVPSARAGARYELGPHLHLRTAAYSGFRVPTLNEFYRPFRLGNNVTLANAALEPERLYGAEVGAGGSADDFAWNATIFFNRLADAITNVTIGTTPQGGLLMQRRNAGDIEAAGIEAEARWRWEGLSLWLAGQGVDARMNNGGAFPLAGKRPAQAPPWAFTAGLAASPTARLSMSLNLRYEGPRYADDRNTLRLDPALTLDARVALRVTESVALYAAADNLLDVDVESTKGPDGVTNYGAPRILRIGVALVPPV